MSLSVELGPGLLESIYDGIQRPLPTLVKQMGNFIKRGVSAPGLDHQKNWAFKPAVKKGDQVEMGQTLGTVPENRFDHRVMVPNGMNGTVDDIREGNFTLDEVVA